MSFSAQQRASEISVRMMLGATRGSVVRMVVREGLTPVAAGLGAGLGLSLLATPAVTRLLFAVGPTDPPTYAAVVITLATGLDYVRAATRLRRAGLDRERTSA